MTKRKAGPISDADEARIQAQIARDLDAPEVTDEQAAQARPASEAMDVALFTALVGRGRPRSANAKKLVTLRLPPEVIEGYQAGGPGWQVRMGEVLAGGLHCEQSRMVYVQPAPEGGFGAERSIRSGSIGSSERSETAGRALSSDKKSDQRRAPLKPKIA